MGRYKVFVLLRKGSERLAWWTQGSHTRSTKELPPKDMWSLPVMLMNTYVFIITYFNCSSTIKRNRYFAFSLTTMLFIWTKHALLVLYMILSVCFVKPVLIQKTPHYSLHILWINKEYRLFCMLLEDCCFH